MRPSCCPYDASSSDPAPRAPSQSSRRRAPRASLNALTHVSKPSVGTGNAGHRRPKERLGISGEARGAIHGQRAIITFRMQRLSLEIAGDELAGWRRNPRQGVRSCGSFAAPRDAGTECSRCRADSDICPYVCGGIVRGCGIAEVLTLDSPNVLRGRETVGERCKATCSVVVLTTGT